MNPLPDWRRYWLTAKEARLLLDVPDVLILVAAGQIPRAAVARIGRRVFLHLPTVMKVAAALEAIT